MLLHGDGTNGAQNNTFLDSSTNNFTITRNGNTTQGTFTPYGSNWGMYQSDASSAYLSFTTSVGTSFQFAGDFTIEGWVYYNSSSGDASLYVISDNTNYLALNISMSAGNYNIYLNSGTPTSSFSHGISVGVWTHVAMVRSGSTVTLYTNGVSKGTITNSSTLGFSAPAINRTGGGVSGIDRYISNIRVVKSAVYTSAFTPSTTPLTAITNTSLLTCQSNRFVDNSSNAFTPTITGSPSVQRFSPFAPLTVYNPTTYGGSGYFDGSGDYLSMSQTAVNTSTALTIEGWFYINSTATTQGLWGGGVDLYGINLQYQETSNQKLNLFIGTGGAWGSGYTSNTSLVPYTWYHIAYVRSGTTHWLYINGVVDSSINGITASVTWSGSSFYVGVPMITTRYFNGYVSNLRVSNSVVYSGTFTPPTAPVTGGTLLLNYTNAGILDNAMMNDLETVGNAQISTSVKKYGTGSIALDGTDDRLNMPSSPNLAFGTGDFTLECWAYFTSTANFPTLTDSRANTSSTAGFNLGLSTAKVQLYTTSQLLIGSSTLSTNTWYHIAVTRASGTLKIWLNGVQDATVANSTNWSDQSFVVGATPNAANLMSGNIDELRLTKGYCRYTSTFTPPTAAFPNN